MDLDAVPEADDDASLYCLFGFALHVGMKFRKKTTYGHLCSYFCPSRRKQYAVKLAVLKTLVETDKSILPAVVRFQDRGKMTFPHQVLLPFMCKCSRLIKLTLNCKQFKLQGKIIISNTKQYILYNQELKGEFKTVISFCSESTSLAVVNTLHKGILRRVINTMANSFIQSQAMLARIAYNKGVDIEMAYRNKLKAYAIDKHTQLKL